MSATLSIYLIFGDTHRSGMDYADTLAENGYVVYCFDFCGGGPGSKSDGSMTEMSLFTEQSDLEAVCRFPIPKKRRCIHLSGLRFYREPGMAFMERMWKRPLILYWDI